MWHFNRQVKPQPRPEPTEIERHQEALRYFVRNRTSVGCYGLGEELNKALAAMRFFVDADLRPTPEEDSSAAHQQKGAGE